jgi:hypothetical protein
MDIPVELSLYVIKLHDVKRVYTLSNAWEVSRNATEQCYLFSRASFTLQQSGWIQLYIELGNPRENAECPTDLSFCVAILLEMYPRNTNSPWRLSW